MHEAVREMTFEEEYEILQREKERVFASEKEGYEPPLANCVLRRALRCIDKLMKTSRREWYQKGYQDGLNAGKWIPCEVELPPQPKENPSYENKPLEVYLVSVKNCEEPFRAFWNGKNFTDGWSKLNVEAWQQLPQPYKKEGAE